MVYKRFLVVNVSQIIKKLKKTLKKGLTKWDESGIIYKLSRRAVLESEQRGH